MRQVPNITAAAYSPNKINCIYILKVDNQIDVSKWKIVYTLTPFTKPANVIVWSSDKKILATSHDNNCMVLEFDDKAKKWISHLVNLETQYRSLRCGAWSSDGKKFAVAGGNKSVYIGYWDDKMRCYNSDRLKKCKVLVPRDLKF